MKVKEGETIELVPAIRAVMRAMFANAAKGNGPAQRAFCEFLRASEQALASETAAKAKDQSREAPDVRF